MIPDTLNRTVIPVYVCPVANIGIKTPCKVTSCMYHNTDSAKCCSYSNLNASLHRDATITKEMRKKVVCEFFKIEEADLAVSIRRLVSVLMVNEFFYHVYDKDVLEARPKELQALKDRKESFERWKPSAKKISFDELVNTVDFLQTNLL